MAESVEVDVSSSSPLISRGPASRVVDQPQLTQLNFLLMSTSMSLTHASMLLAINYASSVLDTRLGVVSDSVVYLTYTLGSLLASTWLVHFFKPRKALLIASMTYIIYLSLFVLVCLGHSI